jgi:GNAT superfamily N-acetyltransferase
MNFRLAEKSDLDKIMEIIEEAKDYLKTLGIDQWQNGYPNEEKILSDIENRAFFVLEEEEIMGITFIGITKDPTYDKIYQGEWLSNGDYGVIHRMAVGGKYRKTGTASLLMKYTEEHLRSRNIKSIKVDTHRGNTTMHNFLLKNAYVQCGVIYLEDGNERLAYEKLL